MPTDENSAPQPKPHPFRRAVLRGLAIVLPPLLTVVIFVWIGRTIGAYVLEPVKSGARIVLVQVIDDGVEQFPEVPNDQNQHHDSESDAHYHRLPKKSDGSVNKYWVPEHVYKKVRENLGNEPIPTTREAMLARYVDVTWLTPEIVIPVFTCVFILVMYLLGKFLAAGIGRFFLDFFERLIHRLPLIRNVYSSVKQITDFLLSEREVEYTRVVAVEYPRKGIWSFGLVTGESMLDIRSAANEPVISVLIPTSPMPMTGFTVTVKKSEAVDLDLSIDQAFQFIVSCGVVVPAHQLQKHLSAPAAIVPQGAGEIGVDGMSND